MLHIPGFRRIGRDLVCAHHLCAHVPSLELLVANMWSMLMLGALLVVNGWFVIFWLFQGFMGGSYPCGWSFRGCVAAVVLSSLMLVFSRTFLPFLSGLLFTL